MTSKDVKNVRKQASSNEKVAKSSKCANHLMTSRSDKEALMKIILFLADAHSHVR